MITHVIFYSDFEEKFNIALKFLPLNLKCTVIRTKKYVRYTGESIKGKYIRY
jgi:hypothetical protein